MVAHITNTNPAIVTVPNDEQVDIHIGVRPNYELNKPWQVEFGIGEWVQFKGVEGMTEINGVEVKVC